MTSPLDRMVAGSVWHLPGDVRHLAGFRLAVTVYATVLVAVRAPEILRAAGGGTGRFDPVGPLSPVFAVTGAPPTWAVAIAIAVTVALGVAATAGWRWRTTGPAFAVAVLAVLSHRYSFGVVLHTDHLTVVHLGVLAASPAAADAFSLDARAGRTAPRHDLARRPLIVCGVATAAAYVVAGVAKVLNGGWAWVDGEVLRTHVAKDTLRKDLLGDIVSPVADVLVPLAPIWGPMALAAVAVELTAPLALTGPRTAIAFALATWSFHVGVLVIMAILFPYQLLGIAAAPWLLARMPPATVGEPVSSSPSSHRRPG